MRLFPLLLMFFLLLVPTASALPHDSYPSFAHPQSRAVLGSFNESIIISDTIVYHAAYYNLPETNDWVPFSLGNNFYSNSDSWLDGAGFSDSLPAFPAVNESYILFYSCTLTKAVWDCHGNEDYPNGFWQLIVINTGVEQEPVPVEPSVLGAESPLLAGVPIIHDQTFLIPETARAVDTVGDLNLMWVSPEQDIVYSLVDDASGRFVLNHLAGRNTVSNHLLNYEMRIAVASGASFDYDAQREYSIIIRATDQSTGEYQDATITIKLSKEENTYYIDPDWVGCEDGSRDCPYNSWIEDVSGGIWNWGSAMRPGDIYLQKRGTTYEFQQTGNQDYYGFTISVNGTPDEHIVIGAYGSGDRPLFASMYSDSATNTYGGGRGITMKNPLSYYDFYSLAFTNASVGIITSQMGFNQLTYTDLHFFDNHGVGIYSWVTERNANPPFTQGDVEDRYGKITDCYAEGMGYTKGRDTMPDDNYGFKLAGPQRMDISYTVVRDNEAHGFSNAAASTEFRYCQSYGNRIGVKAHGNDILIDHMLIANNTELGILNGNYYANYGLDTKRFHMTDSLVYGGERGIDIQENVTGGLIENSVFRNFTNSPDTYQSASAVRIYDTDPYSTDFEPPTNYTFRNNFFLDGEDYAIVVGDGSDPPRSIFFHNNVIAGFGRSGFHIMSVQGLKMYNNLLYDTGCRYVGGTCHISTDTSYSIEGVVIRNNLLEDEPIVASYMTAPLISNNLVYNDSFFVDAANSDFSLQESSSAIDAGMVIDGFHCPTAGVHPNSDCVQWFGLAPDLGAFESNFGVSEPVVDSSCLRTFYVSSSEGNDFNDGFSEQFSWRTITKVNSQSFLPGDCILFKRGDSWTVKHWSEALRIHISPDYGYTMIGAPDNPIIFGAYGEGVKPIITARDSIPGWDDPARWEDLGSNIWRMADADVVMNIYVINQYPPRGRLWLDGIEVQKSQSLTVPEPSRPWTHEGDDFYLYSPQNPAMYFTNVESVGVVNNVLLSQADYITIQNLDFRGSGNALIFQGGSHVIIENCSIGRDVGMSGLSATQADHFIVRNNVFDTHDRLMDDYLFNNAEDGLWLGSGCDDWDIYGNSFRDWSHTAFTMIQQQDEAPLTNIRFHHNSITAQNIDYGRGFAYNLQPVLGVNTGNEVHHNSIRDVPTQSQINGDGLKVYNNIFDNTTGSSYRVDSGDCLDMSAYSALTSNNKIYNNVFMNCQGAGVMFGYTTFTTENNSLTNNIFYNNDEDDMRHLAYYIGEGLKQNEFRNNLFYDMRTSSVIYYAKDAQQWEAQKTVDEFNEMHLADVSELREDPYGTPDSIQNNVFGDPLLADNYSLLIGSPAIDAGMLIDDFHCPTAGVYPESDCVQWFGLAPDIGPLEYQG